MKPLPLAASFAALAAVGWLLFGDVRHHGFTFDDEDYLDNARRAWSDLGHLVSPEMEKPWASRVGVRVYAWLAYPLFGSAPGPYHLVNAAGHLLNALLLLHLVYLRRSSAPLAFLSALLFLANTSHFRAVYWISAVSLVFGVGFVLASLLLVCRYLRGGGKGWLAGGVCSYCAAVLCHQAMGMAAFFPALLAAEEGRPRRQQLRLLILFLLPGCAILGADAWSTAAPSPGTRPTPSACTSFATSPCTPSCCSQEGTPAVPSGSNRRWKPSSRGAVWGPWRWCC